MKKIILISTILIACATAIIAYPTNNVKSISLSLLRGCESSTDTLQVRLSWQSVTDRRGAPVVRYLTGVTRNGTIVHADSTTMLADTARITCANFGDSIRIQGNVAARDNRGNLGAVGSSNILTIHTNDPGPVAPVITIDTIAGIEPDSIQIFATGAPDKIINYFINNKVLGDGYTIQLCPLIWKDGESFYPSNYITRCSNIGLTYYHTQRYGD